VGLFLRREIMAASVVSNVYRVISLATTNAALIKGAAGRVQGWYIFNTSANTRFIKLYNKATAPTVGTDTPFLTLAVPSGGGANVWIDGITFSAGIGIGMTTAAADNSTAAVSAGDVIVNLFYV